MYINSGVDPHHLDADPDHFDADLDPVDPHQLDADPYPENTKFPKTFSQNFFLMLHKNYYALYQQIINVRETKM